MTVEGGDSGSKSSKKALTQSMLDSLNVPQMKDENLSSLEGLGGTGGLAKLVGVNLETGLTAEQVRAQREAYGNNAFPESPMDSFFELLLAALSDTTLLILLFAAGVSLVIGCIEDPSEGWIEGCAIFIAVFLVANISAGNDYSKQLQFKALEASTAEDERTSVFRDGFIERINPIDLVVGDIIVLQVRCDTKTNVTIVCSDKLLKMCLCSGC
jgi:magnesium-transporting ATPase (P-type)